MKEYRVTARYRYDKDRHEVANTRRTDYEKAVARYKRVIYENNKRMKMQRSGLNDYDVYKSMRTYQPELDLVDIQLESREISEWEINLTDN